MGDDAAGLSLPDLTGARTVTTGDYGVVESAEFGQRSFQPAPVASYSSTRARTSAFRSSVGSSRS
jgi:hypothetical protein